jgi:hypothetical protein
MRRNCHQGCDFANFTPLCAIWVRVGRAEHHRTMRPVFLGTEALARGDLTRGQLRWNYRSIYRDVYIPRNASRSLRDNTVAAWLWSGRRGVVTGRAAAAWHGAEWVDQFAPVELIGRIDHPPPGIIVRRERFGSDEVVQRDGLPVTTAARTAFDLARHLPRGTAVTHLDALARATGITTQDVAPLAAHYRGARGVRRCRTALSLMDAGSQSPKETWLRLVLIDAGLPVPRTQIKVTDGRTEAFVDMGYDEPRVGVEYDGDHHRTDRSQYVHDIGRAEMLERMGWIVFRVIAEHSPRFIIHRVRQAFARRGYSPAVPPIRLHTGL